MLDRIRKNFGSVSTLARRLDVSGDEIYLAIDGHMEKRSLLKRILRALKDL